MLKSGCRIERLQLRQAERLERAVAVYAAVAWWLLWLSYLARAQPEAPCTVVLSPAMWQALWATQHKSLPLPAEPPDLRTVVRWIAQLGGFLARKGDGEPGVQTLWRGLRRLEDIAATWTLANPIAHSSISFASGAHLWITMSPKGEGQGEGETQAPDGAPASAMQHLDFAIGEFREMKMQPALERALRHKEVLKA